MTDDLIVHFSQPREDPSLLHLNVRDVFYRSGAEPIGVLYGDEPATDSGAASSYRLKLDAFPDEIPVPLLENARQAAVNLLEPPQD